MSIIPIKKHESIFSKNEPTFLFSGEVIPITNHTYQSTYRFHTCLKMIIGFHKCEHFSAISRFSQRPKNTHDAPPRPIPDSQISSTLQNPMTPPTSHTRQPNPQVAPDSHDPPPIHDSQIPLVGIARSNVIFLMFHRVLWGLNYSKMSNQGPRTYGNIFWMISGTSKKLSKSGPMDLLMISRTLPTKSRKTCGMIFGTYYFSHLRIWNFEDFRNLGTCRFHFPNFYFVEISIFEMSLFRKDEK